MNSNLTKEGIIKNNLFERNPKKTILFIILFIVIVIEMFGQLAYFVLKGETIRGINSREASHTEFSPYGMTWHKSNGNIMLKKNLAYPSDLILGQYGDVLTGNNINQKNVDYTIVMLGGSTMEGRGASSNSNTIAGYLERKLNTKFNVKVYNFGHCGHMTYQQLQLFEGYISNVIKADIVIGFDGRNDAYYGISHKHWRKNWQPYYDTITKSIQDNMNDNSFLVLNKFSKISATGKVLNKMVSMILSNQSESIKFDMTNKLLTDSGRTKSIINSYFNNHDILKSRAEMNGARYIAFLQPVLTNRLKNGTISDKENHIIKDWNSHFSEKNYFFNALDDFFKEASLETNKLDWFYDISSSLANKTNVYHDSCHYTDYGNELIAEEMATVLSEKIIKDIEKK
jgi:hypothetical protein